MEVLEAYGLPKTFPKEMVPVPIHQFILDTQDSAITRFELVERAHNLGFDPVWEPLPHIGPDVYGFGLTFGGLVVPLMVKMKEAG